MLAAIARKKGYVYEMWVFAVIHRTQPLNPLIYFTFLCNSLEKDELEQTEIHELMKTYSKWLQLAAKSWKLQQRQFSFKSPFLRAIVVFISLAISILINSSNFLFCNYLHLAFASCLTHHNPICLWHNNSNNKHKKKLNITTIIMIKFAWSPVKAVVNAYYMRLLIVMEMKYLFFMHIIDQFTLDSCRTTAHAIERQTGNDGKNVYPNGHSCKIHNLLLLICYLYWIWYFILVEWRLTSTHTDTRDEEMEE